MFNPCLVKTASLAIFFGKCVYVGYEGVTVYQLEFSRAIEHLIDISYLSHEIFNTIACLLHAQTHFVINVAFCNNCRILK